MTATRVAAGAVAGGALMLCAGLALGVGSLVQGLAQAEAWHQSPGFFPIAAMLLAATAAAAKLRTLAREVGADAQASAPSPDTDAPPDARFAAADDAADEFDASTSRPRLAAQALVVLLLYPAAIDLAGLVPATVAFVTAIGVLAGLPPRRAVVVALVLALTLHAVFVVGFKVWFPEPWIVAAFKGGA